MLLYSTVPAIPQYALSTCSNRVVGCGLSCHPCRKTHGPRHCCHGPLKMVGLARFELTTFRPPDGRANQTAPQPDEALSSGFGAGGKRQFVRVSQKSGVARQLTSAPRPRPRTCVPAACRCAAPAWSIDRVAAPARGAARPAGRAPGERGRARRDCRQAPVRCPVR